MFLDLDQSMAAHLAVAVNDYRRRFAVNGRPAPAWLHDLEDSLRRRATEVHEGPTFAAVAELLDAPTSENVTCGHCGGLLPVQAHQGMRRRWCSESCRSAARRQSRREMRVPA